jgi:hypothetical protein
MLKDFWGIEFPTLLMILLKNGMPAIHTKSLFSFLAVQKITLLLTDRVFTVRIIKDIPGFHRKFLFVLGDLFPTISFMKNRYKCNSTLKVLFYYPHRLGKGFVVDFARK